MAESMVVKGAGVLKRLREQEFGSYDGLGGWGGSIIGLRVWGWNQRNKGKGAVWGSL